MHRKGVLVPSTLFTDTCSLVFSAKTAPQEYNPSFLRSAFSAPLQVYDIQILDEHP